MRGLCSNLAYALFHDVDDIGNRNLFRCLRSTQQFHVSEGAAVVALVAVVARIAVVVILQRTSTPNPTHAYAPIATPVRTLYS